jgi:hypothetical protein
VTANNRLALELNRAFAMSTTWDEAAEALRQAIHTGDFTRHDQAMTRFRELNFTRGPAPVQQTAGGNHGD